jgi:hypothetical protein
MDGVDLRIALLKTTGAGRLPLLGMLDFLEHFGGCSFLKCRYIENNSASCASTPATSLDNSLHCCRGCSISPSMSKCMLAPSRSTRSSKELCESTRCMEFCGVILFAGAFIPVTRYADRRVWPEQLRKRHWKPAVWALLNNESAARLRKIRV